MTYKEIKSMLGNIGLPVVYDHWPENKAPNPPYICFFFPGDNDFIGDNSNYAKIRELTVQLYTDQKDFELEETVEQALSAFVYDRYEEFISDENLYLVSYEMEVLINAEES